MGGGGGGGGGLTITWWKATARGRDSYKHPLKQAWMGGTVPPNPEKQF